MRKNIAKYCKFVHAGGALFCSFTAGFVGGVLQVLFEGAVWCSAAVLHVVNTCLGILRLMLMCSHAYGAKRQNKTAQTDIASIMLFFRNMFEICIGYNMFFVIWGLFMSRSNATCRRFFLLQDLSQLLRQLSMAIADFLMTVDCPDGSIATCLAWSWPTNHATDSSCGG